MIFAVGQVADLSFLGADHGLEMTARGTLAVDRRTLATSARGVYAGGDVAFGPRIVIEAVAEGRRAAKAIDTLLTGRQDAPPELTLRVFNTHGYAHPFAAGDYEQLRRGVPATLPILERTQEAQVELPLSEAAARSDGARCLHCWINTVFDSRAMSGSECIQCGGCVDICPVDCLDLVSLLRIANDAGARERGAAMLKDETPCIRCGLCARRCPAGVISMQGFYLGDEAALLAACERSL